MRQVLGQTMGPDFALNTDFISETFNDSESLSVLSMAMAALGLQGECQEVCVCDFQIM